MPSFEEEITIHNPLHHVVLVAEINRRMWLKQSGKSDNGFGETWLVPLPRSAVTKHFPTREGEPVYPKVETVGVVGAYRQIDAMPGYEVVFCNDLAYETCGIDVIAKHRESGRYLICEAKGTTGAFGSPAAYLKTTKHKGRQLSWQWAWNSMVEFADSPTASSVFLELYRSMILEQGIDRLLCVTKAEKIPGGYVAGETRTWGETKLSYYEWFRITKDWGKLLGWLGELNK
jgi:hypothetical protein